MAAVKTVNIEEAFGAYISLPDRISIYVPSQDKHGAKIDNAKWVDRTLTLLAEINGGATAMPPVQGAWLNDEGKLIKEQPVVVYAFIRPDAFETRLSEIVGLVKEIGIKTNQGEMAVEFNNELFLIKIEQ
ncbi:hypothetical protein ABIB38_002278 [Massilia sp. UYP11]|uniref:hypothetical protein n=1 Tax=Massilia sp. UYP11 TaxID=1756385 RepID=UPI003D263DBB